MDEMPRGNAYIRYCLDPLSFHINRIITTKMFVALRIYILRSTRFLSTIFILKKIIITGHCTNFCNCPLCSDNKKMGIKRFVYV